jgi:hypothetical protein
MVGDEWEILVVVCSSERRTNEPFYVLVQTQPDVLLCILDFQFKVTNLFDNFDISKSVC